MARARGRNGRMLALQFRLIYSIPLFSVLLSFSRSLLCVCCEARAGGSVWFDNGRPGRGKGCREEWEAISKSYYCH